MIIYDRKKQSYSNYKESKGLNFLYKNFIGRCFLKILTAKWLTNIGAKYMQSPLSKFRIKKFIRKNAINMDEYKKEDYHNFNDFFTRRINLKYRPLKLDKKLFLSPCDSKLMVYNIDDNLHLHIKNSCYKISELINDEKLAAKYKKGLCLVFRLCVDDYHRYSFIDDGEIVKTEKIDGVLHTVRPIAYEHCKVFSQNKREYSVLKTEHFGTITQIEVGALLVGKICNFAVLKFERGDEKGYFQFGGSTIILLIERDKVKIDQDIIDNSSKDIETKIQLFEEIGRSMSNV